MPKNLNSLFDLISLNNLNGLNNLYSPILSKDLLVLMVGSSLEPKMPILAPFCGMDHQRSNSSLISDTFLLEAVQASRCYFPHLLKPLGTLIQENYSSFYPFGPFRIPRFNMRHPVSALNIKFTGNSCGSYETMCRDPN